MIVAGLLRHFAFHEEARGLEIEHEDLRLQERGRDLLALAGLFPLEEGDEDAERCEQSGAQVGHRNTDAHRPVSRQAGDRHQPAHALRDLVEAGPVSVRPILAEAGDAGVDEARIDARQRLVVDAQALLHAGPEILHDHVRLPHHALERGEAFRRLEIQRQAALVAMQVLEVGALARAAHRLFRPGRRFDLDDVGAPVGELARASRPCPHAGEVEDGETGQGF